MKNLSTGFERLRGLASAGIVAAATAGGASAAPLNLPSNISRATSGASNRTMRYLSIGNGFTGLTPSSSDGCSNTRRIFNSGSSPATLTTNSGSYPGCGGQAFGIHYVSLASGSPKASFSHMMSVLVDNEWFLNPDSTVDFDTTTNTLNSDVVVMSDVNVSVTYKFFGAGDIASDRAAARAVYTLENPTIEALEVKLNVVFMPYQSRIFIKGSSDGDTDLNDDEDKWFYGNDRPPNVGVEAEYNADAILTRFGDGASVIPSSVGLGFRSSVFSYELTIPAGRTVRVMNFAETTTSVADAEAKGPDYESLTTLDAAGFLENMSDAEITSLVNYAYPVPSKNNSGSGAVSPWGIFSLFLLILVSRTGRKKQPTL